MRFNISGFTAIILLVLVNSQIICAQNFPKQWLFKGFSISFAKDSAYVSLNNLSSHNSAGYSSICDADGNLLLYTNGFKAWNYHNELLENGNDLIIPGTEGTSLIPTMIIPAPGHALKYYIFTLNPFNGNEASGLYYAEADMSANNGKGIILTKRNRLIDSTTNKLTALYHADKKNIWIITHHTESNSYYAFKIDNEGISTLPVISSLGKITNTSFDGQLKGSPDGKRIAVCYSTYEMGEGFDLFDFDNETGKLSNAKSFLMPTRGCNGLEFSSDATKLYVHQFGSTGESGLFQYDLTGDNFDSINNSRYLLLQSQITGLQQMQIGSDGIIYIAKGGGFMNGAQFFGVIKKPNEKGEKCEALELGLDLKGEMGSSILFPNYIQNYFFKTNYNISGLCFGDSAHFNITNTTGLDSVHWNFGDNNYSKHVSPNHKYKSTGNYMTCLIAYYSDKSDTIFKQISIFPTPSVSLGRDTTVCSGYIYEIKNNFEKITWHDGSNAKYYSAMNSGTYWVRVKNQFGCEHSDTIDVLVNPSPIVNIGKDTVICDNASLILTVNSENIAYDLLWNDDTKESSMQVNEEGVYWLQVTNENNCITKDFITVNTKPSPIIDLGKDTTISGFSRITLDAGYFNYPTNYTWNSNSFSRFNIISGVQLPPGSNPFWVEVQTLNKCKGYDTIDIHIIHDFRAYNACFGRNTMFVLGSENYVDSAFWNFGDGNFSHLLRATHQYSQAGQYNVSVVIYSNEATDTLRNMIQIVPLQDVNLGEDVIIGNNSFITLDAGSYTIPVFYTWEDHSTNQTRQIVGSELGTGTHTISVQVSTYTSYCTSSDTIKITLENITSTIDIEKDNMYLYPNPVKDILYINNPENSIITATLRNSAGIIIETWQLENGLNLFCIENLQQGLYIFQVPGKTEIKIIKL